MGELKIPAKSVPHNFGPMRGYHGHAKVTGPCGDTMEFWTAVAEGEVRAVTYTTDGCAHSLLAGYAAATLATGVDIEDARDVDADDVLRYLGGLPPESAHCARLAANVLQAAIEAALRPRPLPS